MNISKAVVLAIFIATVLCAGSSAQSTFFLDEDLEVALLSEYNFLHGFGVSSYSSYQEQDSFDNACENAIEDLNSSVFISIYIEEFRSGVNTDYSFPELSVKDSVLTLDDNIVKQDSFIVSNNAYCVVSFQDNSEAFSEANIPSFDQVRKSPIKVGNHWFALGAEDVSKYNPTLSWMRAKNEALKDLTRVLKTQIQSSVISIDDKEAELTYFKSNIIFEDIIPVRRYLSKDKFIVMIAVPENKLYQY